MRLAEARRVSRPQLYTIAPAPEDAAAAADQISLSCSSGTQGASAKSEFFNVARTGA